MYQFFFFIFAVENKKKMRDKGFRHWGMMSEFFMFSLCGNAFFK